MTNRTAADTIDLLATLACEEATARRTAAAQDAVKTAWGYACGFAGAAEDLDRHVSAEDRETAREMAWRDAAPTARALSEASRLLAESDPLGDIDDEEVLASVLREAWALYRQTLVTLRQDAAAAVA